MYSKLHVGVLRVNHKNCYRIHSVSHTACKCMYVIIQTGEIKARSCMHDRVLLIDDPESDE